MLIHFLLLYCVTFFSPEVTATGENDVKRGEYSFMAFLYYPDDKILDETDTRFLRGAILIHENWLISASIETKSEVHVGFPRKTLLARLGATHIDANYTLNEDEDEQEREIVQIVKPAHHKRTQWWLTDINLLKTLLPFNMTSTVSITTFQPRREGMTKCSILVFSTRYHNRSDDRFLMKLHIDLYSPTINECGTNFNSETMICGGESEENTHDLYKTMFCEGNRGGPLICENDIIGLQTYINDCKPPYLYQLLSSWDNLISCGMEEKCSDERCSKVCTSVSKDEELSTQKASPKKAAIHNVSSYFIDADETKNYTGPNTATNSNLTTDAMETTSLAPSPSARTTPIIMRSEDEEWATKVVPPIGISNETLVTVIVNMTTTINTTTNNFTNIANETEIINTTSVSTTTRREYNPGYFLETSEFSDFTDNASPSATTVATPSTENYNLSKHFEGTTDMMAEAAQDVPTETYIIEKVRAETPIAKVDIFNESTIRTYTKYEPNPEPVTSRVHGYVDDDSNENESVEVGVNVTPRKLSTLTTQHVVVSPKPTQVTTTSHKNITETGTTFWPIQKIATKPSKSNKSSEHVERRSRVELQLHRQHERTYTRSAANRSEQWSIVLFLTALAFNCL